MDYRLGLEKIGTIYWDKRRLVLQTWTKEDCDYRGTREDWEHIIGLEKTGTVY